MVYKRNEALVGVLIFLFGAVTAYLSVQMPIGTFRAAGSGLFPLCLGILLMALSGSQVARVMIQASREKGEKAAPSEMRGSVRQVVLFMGAMVLGTLLMTRLGYPLTFFLLLLALLRILGMEGWLRNVMLSFLAAAVSYFLFVQWLKIPLPKGWVGL
ncbi:MAG: tripartite tricarboxylate transporter TctB family protein [Thermodesulfobacteriota bacterium]